MGEGLNSSLEGLFGKMEKFITSKTVVGEPVNINGVILIPLVEVTFGVGAGVANTSTLGDKAKDGDKSKGDGKDYGGGALGGKIIPSAVVVIMDGTVQMVNVKNQESVNKLIDMVPGILAKFNLGSLFNKKSDKKDESKEKEDEKAETAVDLESGTIKF
ncbi:MAG: sporulation protein [Defluviitaleaceae bacterium]|nr:sporulation protein [Defluviitaleaceae bacterium]